MWANTENGFAGFWCPGMGPVRGPVHGQMQAVRLYMVGYRLYMRKRKRKIPYGISEKGGKNDVVMVG